MKHYGTPAPASTELAQHQHGTYKPRHCACLPCTYHLTAQHIGREGLAR